jgi:hypothetical protein
VSRPVLAVRAVLVLAGAVALAAGWGPGLARVAVLAGLAGLVAAALRPDSLGPAAVLAAAGLAWAVDSGTDQAPAPGTVLVAVALAVHHQAAALAAALPPRATVEPAVLARAGRHLALVLGLTVPVALVALALARPGGSVPLELLGLAAAVLAVAVPVGLSRVGQDTG